MLMIKRVVIAGSRNYNDYVEAKKYIDEMHAFEEELEREFEELERAVEKCILKMSKPDLQNVLLELLLDGPDWQYDKFVREYVD